MSETVLITGGAGYVGSVLTPRLLASGYRVVVYDALYFGNHLREHPSLTVIEGDIRDTGKLRAAIAEDVEAVIHLACLSNDPSFELDEAFAKSVNHDCFEPMVVAAKEAGVKRFIYCSSSSVYGVSDAPDVTEDHPLVPLTLYNKFKGLCEPLLLKHQADDFTCVVLRPATVCGYSPRMRLDLSVNILTAHAVMNDRITVFGGQQLRPNLHIQDMCDLYELVLKLPAEKIAGQTFNAGGQNRSIAKIAETARTIVLEEYPEKNDVEIVTSASNDLRSYHINSDKIFQAIGFAPQRTLENAVQEICRAFRESRLPDAMEDDRYYNVRRMKALGVG